MFLEWCVGWQHHVKAMISQALPLTFRSKVLDQGVYYWWWSTLEVDVPDSRWCGTRRVLFVNGCPCPRVPLKIPLIPRFRILMVDRDLRWLMHTIILTPRASNIWGRILDGLSLYQRKLTFLFIFVKRKMYY